MEDIFINKIHINKVRHLENVEISLSDTERKHLILTGKNGSGKTSVLEGLGTFLTKIKEYGFGFNESFLKNRHDHIAEVLGRAFNENVFGGGIIDEYKEMANEYFAHSNDIKNKSAICSFIGYNDFEKNSEIKHRAKLSKLLIPDNLFLIASFDAHRKSIFDISSGPFIDETPLGFVSINQDLSKLFIQYLVNLRYERLNALEKGEELKVEKIKLWFDKFQNALRYLFDDNQLVLEYNHEKYIYKIIQRGRDPFSFNEMASGFSAIMRIVAELIYRMKNSELSTDLQGIVLIDEIETHLHIDLQKKILPFLTSFFPKIQFIVTTHSPFVLSSIDNAIIYDLETKQRVEDLSGYSTGAIIESYFNSDTYSDEVKKKVDKYETLLNKETLTEEEESQKFNLERYFEDLPKTLSPELSLKISQLELAKLAL